jgi:hypothetical protein
MKSSQTSETPIGMELLPGIIQSALFSSFTRAEWLSSAISAPFSPVSCVPFQFFGRDSGRKDVITPFCRVQTGWLGLTCLKNRLVRGTDTGQSLGFEGSTEFFLISFQNTFQPAFIHQDHPLMTSARLSFPGFDELITCCAAAFICFISCNSSFHSRSSLIRQKRLAFAGRSGSSFLGVERRKTSRQMERDGN